MSSMAINIETACKADCLHEAERLLGMAVRAEESGKPAKMVDFALNKACAAENAAFDGRQ